MKKKILIISGISIATLLLAFLGYIGVAYFTAGTEVELKGLNTNVTINSTNNYPTLKFDGGHILKINGKTKEISDSKYKIKAGDLDEGENTITIKRQEKILFLTKEGETKTYKINVDRIEPELTLTTPNSKFVLLKNFSFSASGEDGAEIYSDETKIGVLSADKQKFTVELSHGENKFSIYAKDSAGNSNDPQEFTIEAFKKDGWTAVTCGKVSFPIDSKTMQKGYSSVTGEGVTLSMMNNTKCSASGSEIFLIIAPKNAVAKCGGGFCEGDPLFTLMAWGDAYKEGKETSNTIKSITKYTSKSGVAGVIREASGSTFQGNFNNYSFVFPVKGKAYEISKTGTTSEPITNADKDLIKEIADALVVN